MFLFIKENCKNCIFLILSAIYLSSMILFGHLWLFLSCVIAIPVAIACKRALKMKDEAFFYIVALTCSGLLITIGGLGYDDVKFITGEVAKEDLLFVKVICNMFGLSLFSIAIKQLELLAKPKQKYKKLSFMYKYKNLRNKN
ncbi:hypothetical protein CHY23_01727 [Actinobacillus pleuropneumoniae]|nr:hypothetical protein CHY23_01727 [Actinobacillus pleuropneumoniae]